MGKKNESNKWDSTHDVLTGQDVGQPKEINWTIMKTDGHQHTRRPGISLEGSRTINVDKLQQHTVDLTKHPARCRGSIVLCGDMRWICICPQ